MPELTIIFGGSSFQYTPVEYIDFNAKRTQSFQNLNFPLKLLNFFFSNFHIWNSFQLSLNSLKLILSY